jgi:glyoxylase-like metal-dependent hydrolase (beta-lactamase superfamily II)
MPSFLCTTCGTQYSPSDAPPALCAVCRQERQYVNPLGQSWTTLEAMRRTHFTTFRQHEPGLLGVGTSPSFAIGQRALLVRSGQTNVLWDCIPFIDDASVRIVRALGGIGAIAISHPDLYSSMVEWSHAFDAPVYLHGADRQWLMRPDAAIKFWDNETKEIAPGITLIRCGGHFEGGTVLHWAAGANGRGALLSGDIVHVGMDKKVSFMRSYANEIPLHASSVRNIADVLDPWPFDSIYGGWYERIITIDGKAILAYSVRRYLAAITGPPRQSA